MLVDGTLGAGGHSALILDAVGPEGRLIAIDRDAAAVARAQQRFGDASPAPVLVQGNFAEMDEIVREAGYERVDGVLLDLGLSSDQLDDPDRGFSFRQDGPLDMRMGSGGTTAEEVVNRLSVAELTAVIRTLGEERWAARIARFVADRRPLRTTRDLARAVEAAIPRKAWPKDIHPATRTFQAIRMHVNRELESLEQGLEAALEILRPEGRLVVISFHSLEDRAVKRFLQRESRGCICPPSQPVCTCQHRPSLTVITRHPVRPTDEEVADNPRSRSARLRAGERL